MPGMKAVKDFLEGYSFLIEKEKDDIIRNYIHEINQFGSIPWSMIEMLEDMNERNIYPNVVEVYAEPASQIVHQPKAVSNPLEVVSKQQKVVSNPPKVVSNLELRVFVDKGEPTFKDVDTLLEKKLFKVDQVIHKILRDNGDKFFTVLLNSNFREEKHALKMMEQIRSVQNDGKRVRMDIGRFQISIEVHPSVNRDPLEVDKSELPAQFDTKDLKLCEI